MHYGSSPALQAVELRRLVALSLFEQDALEQERDLFLLQILLPLRDSDMRQLRPHHVTEMDLPGAGRVLVIGLRQAKTGDEVRLPLPPLAAATWTKWAHRNGLPANREAVSVLSARQCTQQFFCGGRIVPPPNLAHGSCGGRSTPNL